MTAEIAAAIDDALRPRGVAVVVDAVHACMTTRGVHKPGVTMRTSRMLGVFRSNLLLRRAFLDAGRAGCGRCGSWTKVEPDPAAA